MDFHDILAKRLVMKKLHENPFSGRRHFRADRQTDAHDEVKTPSSPLGLDRNRGVGSRGICGGHSWPGTVFAPSISVPSSVVVPSR